LPRDVRYDRLAQIFHSIPCAGTCGDVLEKSMLSDEAFDLRYACETLPTSDLHGPQRAKVKAAIEAFFTMMEHENAVFLQKTMEVYQKEMSAQIEPILNHAKDAETLK
jgi:hypothetical protein